MLTPSSEAELAEIIATAEGPLAVQGGGTRGVCLDGVGLSTAGLSGVTLHDPGALTLVARAGTPLSEIEATLDKERQILPFEPIDLRGLLGTDGSPTIGGVVATNASGPRRTQAGAARDLLLGVRFVDGRGDVLKNGGRVMKNVTGYDLVKFMAGSYGTLGVLTEVSFKVLPRPDARAVLLREGLDDIRAVEALSRALGSPFDVTGAAHVTRGLDGEPVTMIRLEGLEASVAYRAGALAAQLDAFGPWQVERDMEKTAQGWAWVRDVRAFDGQRGDVWRVSVKPSEGPDVVAAVAPLNALYDWGGGLVWLLTEPGRDVRAAVSGIKGHATLIRGDGRRFHPEPAQISALSAGIRAKFDPRGILNPGLMD